MHVETGKRTAYKLIEGIVTTWKYLAEAEKSGFDVLKTDTLTGNDISKLVTIYVMQKR